MMVQTLQVVFLGDGQRQQPDVAERGRPIVTAQVDQTQLWSALWIREGEDHHQQEAHRHHELQREIETETLPTVYSKNYRVIYFTAIK